MLIVAGKADALASLGAMLIGVIVTGLFAAISMTSGGGAWVKLKPTLPRSSPRKRRDPGFSGSTVHAHLL